MTEIDKITLIFQPTGYPKPVNFVYKVERGDYAIISNILLNFGHRNLTKRELKIIKKTYPDFDIDLDDRELTIEDIFDQSCLVDKIRFVRNNVYKISYST